MLRCSHRSCRRTRISIPLSETSLQPAISTPHFPCEAFADVLKCNRTVTHINLGFAWIGDEGTKARRCSRVFAACNFKPAFRLGGSRRCDKVQQCCHPHQPQLHQHARLGCQGQAVPYGCFAACNFDSAFPFARHSQMP